MQYKRTPPIQFIPVFEAAARNLSFKKAASELCVTAPAVGQQVKAFEHWLGKPLFRRHIRQLSLTDEGQYYLKIAQQLMLAHYQGYTEYSRRFEKSSLHVSATFFIAQEVIMPNYLKFNDYSPGTELRIEARMTNVDFDVETIDAGIRFGDGNWHGLDCRKLSSVSVTPVCSKAYAEQHQLNDITELHQHRLIYAEPWMNDWGKHFFGETVNQKYDNIICDSYLAAMKAAADGLGIALAILPTANMWINDQRLALPFPIEIPLDLGFWLVSPKHEQPKPEIDALHTWLQSIFNELPKLNHTLSIFKSKLG